MRLTPRRHLDGSAAHRPAVALAALAALAALVARAGAALLLSGLAVGTLTPFAVAIVASGGLLAGWVVRWLLGLVPGAAAARCPVATPSKAVGAPGRPVGIGNPVTL